MAVIVLTGQLAAAVLGPPCPTASGGGSLASLPTVTLSAAVAQARTAYRAEADLLKFKTEAARAMATSHEHSSSSSEGLAAFGIVIGATAPIHPSQLAESPPLAVPTADVETIAAERARRLPDAAVTSGYKRTAGLDTIVLGVSMARPQALAE